MDDDEMLFGMSKLIDSESENEMNIIEIQKSYLLKRKEWKKIMKKK